MRRSSSRRSSRMDGVLDTYISRAATERDDPAHKLTAKFSGFNAEMHLSQKAYTIRGDAPGITAAGAFGEAGMAGLTIRGESHRHDSGLWLGDGTFNIGRVNYSIVGSGMHGSISGLVQDIGISALTEIRNDRLDARQTVSVGSIAGRCAEARTDKPGIRNRKRPAGADRTIQKCGQPRFRTRHPTNRRNRGCFRKRLSTCSLR